MEFRKTLRMYEMRKTPTRWPAPPIVQESPPPPRFIGTLWDLDHCGVIRVGERFPADRAENHVVRLGQPRPAEGCPRTPARWDAFSVWTPLRCPQIQYQPLGRPRSGCSGPQRLPRTVGLLASSQSRPPEDIRCP